jgi:dTDP-4-dehydrorhamnose reductase
VNAPRIFLTGAAGQVGYELRDTLAPLGSVVATTRAELDLTDEGAIRTAVRSSAPQVIVNAAAHTAVDAAESDVAACTWLNVNVPRILAEEANRCGAWLVHYSTDYVFDGTGTRPYRETDPVAPLGVYGRTKAEGEAAVRVACARHLIIRVAWVYGLRGRNFLLTIRRLAAGGGPLRIVADQVGVPTWSRAIAEGTAGMVRAVLADNAVALAGTYHMAGSGQSSWHEFATEIVGRSGISPAPDIRAISTAEFPTPAVRPAYSVLDAQKCRDTFGVVLPDWQRQLADCLASDFPRS